MDTTTINLIINSLVMLFMAFTVYQSIKIHKDNNDWNRRKAAQDALSIIRDRVPNLKTFYNVFDFNNFNPFEEIKLADINNKITGMKGLEDTLIDYLNYYEYLCSGIRQGVFDEKIIREAKRSKMIREYHRFSSYIKNRRRTISPNAWVEFEIIVNRWKNLESHKNDRVKI